MKRRSFLKGMAVGLAGGLGSLESYDRAKRAGESASTASSKQAESLGLMGDVEAAEPVLSEKAEALLESKNPISSQLAFENPATRLTPEVLKACEEYWYGKFMDPTDRQHRALERAFDRMATDWDGVRHAFETKRVPTDFAFIGVLESHWMPKARSSAGALGTFQFMPGTARRHGLKVNLRNANLDERTDTLKSADAAADLIQYLLGRFENEELALMAYNKNLIWKHAEEKSKPDLASFLEHLNREADALRRSSASAEEFEAAIRPIAENINYPAKFRAILRAAKDWNQGTPQG